MSFLPPSLRFLLRAAAAFALAAPALAEDHIECQPGDQLKYPFDSAAINTYCPPPTAPEKCAATLLKVVDASNKLNAQLASVCGRVGQLDADRAEATALNPKEAFTRISQIYGSAINDFEAFKKSLNDQYGIIGNTLTPENGPLGPVKAAPALLAADAAFSERQTYRSAITDKSLKAMQNLSTVNAPKQLTEAGGDPTLFAARNGTSYMQKIFQQAREANSTITQLSSMKAKADESLASLDRPPDTKDRTTDGPPSAAGGSGLDLKSLAALGTAGAGLAQMMNKQNASSNTASDTGATSPTPPSTNSPDKGAGSSGPASSKLGDSKAPSSSPPIGTTQPKKDPTADNKRIPSGQGTSPYSDISKSSASAFPTTASNPAAAKSAGGGGDGGGGGGGRGAGGDPEAAAAAKQAANGNPGSEETQGIGGGMLGGGGPPPLTMGSPGAPPPPDAGAPPPPGGPEAAMGDLLHEMKETAEGGNAAQGAGVDITMSDEDLFPRVRACYVRIMKAGRVLDSLGEKVTPEEQQN